MLPSFAGRIPSSEGNLDTGIPVTDPRNVLTVSIGEAALAALSPDSPSWTPQVPGGMAGRRNMGQF